MKNLLTVFAVAIAMFIGVQTASAQSLSQDKSKPEVIAKTKTTELTKTLDLTGDQSRTVFRALVTKEVNYQKHVSGKDAKDSSVAAAKKKYDDQLKASMKKTLTKDQYEKWLKMN